MLIWTLLILGVVTIVVRVVYGNRAGMLAMALWAIVALVGWYTGIGVRS